MIQKSTSFFTLKLQKGLIWHPYKKKVNKVIQLKDSELVQGNLNDD